MMFLKRLFINNKNVSSLSLSSPRGTTMANQRRKGFGFGDRSYLRKEQLLMIVLSFVVVIGIVGIAIVNTVNPPSSTQRHARGHRYYDYCYDEQDYEFPWKFMKRPSSLSSLSSSLSRSDTIPLDDDVSYINNNNNNNNNNNKLYYDQSPFYAKLRQSYETYYPPNDDKRSLQAVQDLQAYPNNLVQTHLQASASGDSSSSSSSSFESTESSLYYDIYNCPHEPPHGYPMEWNLLHDVLSQWPADDVEIPASGKIYQGICIFDYQRTGDYEKALRYRNAEVPFVVKGDPDVARSVERWNVPHYLETLLGDTRQGTEFSNSGTFTYWTQNGVNHHLYPMDNNNNNNDNNKWTAPVELTEMTFNEWIEKANITDERLLQPDSPHYYFKLIGCAPGANAADTTAATETDTRSMLESCSNLAGNTKHVPYLADELPFYTQTKSSLYIKETVGSSSSREKSKALNCRFGMKGVMATNHFDGERNFITVLSGERRYILSHPKNCPNMALYPYGHPSARHSAVDWAHPDLHEYPEFSEAKGNEIVLQAGESLFLPSLWFHYIVSLSTNVQCNTRSGMDNKYDRLIDESCGL